MNIRSKKIKIILVSALILIIAATAVVYVIYGNNRAYAADGMEEYANANVGDVVKYGNYYQSADGVTKTPIEWLVVDKNEKTGQLTLLSKHVLAGGSFWGNWYYNAAGDLEYHSNSVGAPSGQIPYNQDWADSTLRAWLNNLERTDVNGDLFTTDGIQLYADKIKPSKAVNISSSGAVNFEYQHSDLKYSIGYSNKNNWTGLLMNQFSSTLPSGYFKRTETNEVFYKRPHNTERPAVNGFLDEAFTKQEQERIIPRVIAGQKSHQWPSATHNNNNNVMTQVTVDKIWVPSTAELNIEEGKDWNSNPDNGTGDNNWSVSTDNGSSDAFAYFRQFKSVTDLTNALKATATDFDKNPKLSNFSIPLDVSQDNISALNTKAEMNYTDVWGNKGTRNYWLRTPSSYWYNGMGAVRFTGDFYYYSTHNAIVGARPAMILSYTK